MKTLLVLIVSSFSLFAEANSSAMRVVSCEENKMVEVQVRPNFATIINFPVKPDNVVLGGQRQFSLEYIKNDLALTALSSASNTNLFVYLLGRRCGFHISTTNSKYDNLIQVRDSEESKMKVPMHE